MTTVPDFSLAQQLVHSVGGSLQTWAEDRAIRRARRAYARQIRAQQREQLAKQQWEADQRRQQVLNQLHLGG